MKIGQDAGRRSLTYIAALLLVSCQCPLARADGDADSQSYSGQSSGQSSGGHVQYGAVQEEQHSSFRLKRPSPIPTAPQLSQPSESLPSMMTPDLTPLSQPNNANSSSSYNSFSNANPTFDNSENPPVTRSTTKWHPGVILTGSTGEQSLNPTCDLSLAAQQAQEYPTSPEAAFIYAVDLTKTSQVEAALKEVRRARNLAKATGDPNYFSRAVGQYEETLAAEPNNECIRYSLGWAYYMQAYLFAERARKEATTQAILAGQAPRKRSKLNTDLLGGASILASVLTGTRPDASVVPHIPGALEDTPSWAQPQIRVFYQKCLAALDGVATRNPKDVWAAVYGAHVREEYDGDHTVALNKLALLKKLHPENPAAAFFLADAYARSGNIAAGASSLSQALQLHLQGK